MTIEELAIALWKAGEDAYYLDRFGGDKKIADEEREINPGDTWATIGEDARTQWRGAAVAAMALIAEEREKCAQEAESWGEPTEVWANGPDGVRIGVAAAIRARGAQQ